jgi:hypothetical protein
MPKPDNRLPQGIAAAHVDFIAHERRKGTTWEAISRTVGVSAKTLSTWWAKRGAYSPYHKSPTREREAKGYTPRKCLRCQIMFDSYGPGNRLCSRCRTAD